MTYAFVGPSNTFGTVQKSSGETIQQANAFVIGDIIRHDGLNFVLAQSNSAANSEWLGIVTAASATAFTVVYSGKATISTGTFVAGQVYFLSAVTAGASTSIQPAAPNISAPVFSAISPTEILVRMLRSYAPSQSTEGIEGASLYVSGAVGFGVLTLSVNTTLNDTHHIVLVDCTSGDKTITLPSTAGVGGREYVIKKTDSSANRVVVTRSGSDTFDGGFTTFTISSQNSAVKVYADTVATMWRVVDFYSAFPFYGLLGVLKGANFNVTTDQLIRMRYSNFNISRIVITNPSISLSTAVGGIYTGASKTGLELVSATQVYSALTSALKVLQATLSADCQTNRLSANIYFSLTTPQGATATGDIYLYGEAYDL